MEDPNYVNYGIPELRDMLDFATPYAVLIVMTVIFLLLQVSRRGLFSNEIYYYRTVGAIFWLSTTWHLLYGEASFFAYDSSDLFYIGDSDTTDLGWNGVLLNTYEITVAGTFILLGILIPSLLFSSNLSSPSYVPLLSRIFGFLYFIPIIFNGRVGMGYFEFLDFVAFIWLAPVFLIWVFHSIFGSALDDV